jgi:hypothetical protein
MLPASREDHEEEVKMGSEGQESQNIIEFDAFPTVFGQNMKATESAFIGIFEHLTG